MLDLFCGELELAMALCGCATVADITPDRLAQPYEYHAGGSAPGAGGSAL